jgi:hypothetical protein
MSEAVTTERLERGFALCAYLVGLDGPVAVPLFESLERELTAIRRTQDTMDRAKRLLESCRDGEQAVFHKPDFRIHRTWCKQVAGRRHCRCRLMATVTNV